MPELLDRADMIIAAGGGERDIAVDTAIMAGLRKTNTPGAFLNERLMSDLRPTLFLAQLPNLLAGNISLVHGVVGSSRTFMGEEAAGVDAVRVAQARIAAGQSELTLVGGAYHGTRWDVLLTFEFGRVALKDKFATYGTAARMAASPSARWARSWCSKARSMRPRVAQNRGRKSRKSIPTAMRARKAMPKRACAGNGRSSRRKSTRRMQP